VFVWPLLVTVSVAAGACVFGGVELLWAIALLVVFEISISFDNAVVNATVLRRMPPIWQRIFLTAGILVAVFGVRLAVPLVCLCTATGEPPQKAALAAMVDPGLTHRITEETAPVLMPFGGIYLLMIFFCFVFAERDVLWLQPVETWLQRIGRVPNLPVLLVLVLIVGIAEADAEHRLIILLSGLAGLAMFLLVNGAAQAFLSSTRSPRSALFLFFYLELLDASFSLDGVIGSFAVSRNVIAIMAGLGIGAVFVRSITVQVVRRGLVAEYRYLEHGAHWAIGALAVTMLLRLHHTISLDSTATGLVGVGLIVAAFLSSLRVRRHVPAHARRSRAFRTRIRGPHSERRRHRRGLLLAAAVTLLTASSVPGLAFLMGTMHDTGAHTPDSRATSHPRATPLPPVRPASTPHTSLGPAAGLRAR
jgi:hypothetical protein